MLGFDLSENGAPELIMEPVHSKHGPKVKGTKTAYGVLRRTDSGQDIGTHQRFVVVSCGCCSRMQTFNISITDSGNRVLSVADSGTPKFVINSGTWVCLTCRSKTLPKK